MFRQHGEKLKWIGAVLILVLAVWMIWQNRKADDEGWVMRTSEPAENGAAGTGDVRQADRRESIMELAAQSAVHTGSANRSEPDDAVSADSEPGDGEPGLIAVHAAGAVRHPGVYYLHRQARVVDVLQAAGGAAAKADLNAVNLASSVADGDQVMIPFQGEAGEGGYMIRGGVISGYGDRVEGNGSSKNRLPGGQPASATVRSSQQKVNINTASAEELTRLPGIGESKARAIIRYRESHGRFMRLEDLVAVGGIGEKTLERLIELIAV